MKPDAFIKIRFRTTSEGGRQGPIVIGEQFFGCPIYIDDEAFDCRILVKSQTLYLGESYEVPIKFLNPLLSLPKLYPGKALKLWEGRDIAFGEVTRVT
jgi:hypothetical protein